MGARAHRVPPERFRLLAGEGNSSWLRTAAANVGHSGLPTSRGWSMHACYGLPINAIVSENPTDFYRVTPLGLSKPCIAEKI